MVQRRSQTVVNLCLGQIIGKLVDCFEGSKIGPVNINQNSCRNRLSHSGHIDLYSPSDLSPLKRIPQELHT